MRPTGALTDEVSTPTLPTYHEAVEAINPTARTWSQAEKTLAWLQEIVTSAQGSHNAVSLTRDQVLSWQYQIAAQVFLDGQVPAPLSAGDVVARHLLGSDRAKYTLLRRGGGYLWVSRIAE